MNSTEFTTLLQNPHLIGDTQTNALDDILVEFPYFQSARAIHLKGLKNKDSFKYNQALKTTAAYTTDRSILFDFITSDTFNQNEISEYIKQNTAYINDLDVVVEDISVNKSVRIDDALKQQIEATRETINPELFQPKIEKQQIASFNLDTNEAIEDVQSDSTNTNTKDAKSILNLGKPLQFDKSETHSFNEWLSLTRFKPIQRETPNHVSEKTEEETKKATLDRSKKFELIDQFISSNPKLEAKKSTTSTHNIANAQMIQPEALMTETLARIYVEQKNYKKAIQSYKILSLKYPEKSGFFADQIKAIEKLQE
ncbi:hypothetical protein [Olleya aquimaris]|uniref:Tetratricopeptide repeat protein n=1 Tax=Olleya aquimaris TaxID=639310 RepID=A0A327RI08_9FLAO|nr:hypothetical protein [Olleya aquimaris]RAJ15174.1 hypothetical protein LY08_01526 [Olleya aquimaris]